MKRDTIIKTAESNTTVINANGSQLSAVVPKNIYLCNIVCTLHCLRLRKKRRNSIQI